MTIVRRNTLTAGALLTLLVYLQDLEIVQRTNFKRFFQLWSIKIQTQLVLTMVLSQFLVWILPKSYRIVVYSEHLFLLFVLQGQPD